METLPEPATAAIGSGASDPNAQSLDRWVMQDIPTLVDSDAQEDVADPDKFSPPAQQPCGRLKSVIVSPAELDYNKTPADKQRPSVVQHGPYADHRHIHSAKVNHYNHDQDHHAMPRSSRHRHGSAARYPVQCHGSPIRRHDRRGKQDRHGKHDRHDKQDRHGKQDRHDKQDRHGKKDRDYHSRDLCKGSHDLGGGSRFDRWHLHDHDTRRLRQDRSAHDAADHHNPSGLGVTQAHTDSHNKHNPRERSCYVPTSQYSHKQHAVVDKCHLIEKQTQGDRQNSSCIDHRTQPQVTQHSVLQHRSISSPQRQHSANHHNVNQPHDAWDMLYDTTNAPPAVSLQDSRPTQHRTQEKQQQIHQVQQQVGTVTVLQQVDPGGKPLVLDAMAVAASELIPSNESAHHLDAQKHVWLDKDQDTKCSGIKMQHNPAKQQQGLQLPLQRKRRRLVRKDQELALSSCCQEDRCQATTPAAGGQRQHTAVSSAMRVPDMSQMPQAAVSTPFFNLLQNQISVMWQQTHVRQPLLHDKQQQNTCDKTQQRGVQLQNRLTPEGRPIADSDSDSDSSAEKHAKRRYTLCQVTAGSPRAHISTGGLQSKVHSNSDLLLPGGRGAGTRDAPTSAADISHNQGSAGADITHNQGSAGADSDVDCTEASRLVSADNDNHLPPGNHLQHMSVADEPAGRKRSLRQQQTGTTPTPAEVADLAHLSAYISSVGGVLPPDWRASIVPRKRGAARSDTYFYSGDGAEFRSKSQVARHLGLPATGRKRCVLSGSSSVQSEPKKLKLESTQDSAATTDKVMTSSCSTKHDSGAANITNQQVQPSAHLSPRLATSASAGTPQSLQTVLLSGQESPVPVSNNMAGPPDQHAHDGLPEQNLPCQTGDGSKVSSDKHDQQQATEELHAAQQQQQGQQQQVLPLNTVKPNKHKAHHSFSRPRKGQQRQLLKTASVKSADDESDENEDTDTAEDRGHTSPDTDMTHEPRVVIQKVKQHQPNMQLTAAELQILQQERERRRQELAAIPGAGLIPDELVSVVLPVACCVVRALIAQCLCMMSCVQKSSLYPARQQVCSNCRSVTILHKPPPPCIQPMCEYMLRRCN